jgi:hypothetical protein
MCHVAEALCETSERLRGAVTAEPSEAISARLERLEERMGRLEERVSLIEAQWLKAAEALRHAATGTP